MEPLRILRHPRHSNLIFNHIRKKSDLAANKENFSGVASGIISGLKQPSVVFRSSSNKLKAIQLNEKVKIDLNKINLFANKQFTARNEDSDKNTERIRRTSGRIRITSSTESLMNREIANKKMIKNAPEFRGINVNRFYIQMNASKERLESFYRKNT